MRILSAIILLTLLVSCSEDQQRIRQSWNENWNFNKGEVGGESLSTFNDSQWRSLNLPHDWAIEGPFDSKYDTRTGGLPVYGTAWYRKHFQIDSAHLGKSITLEFDGVMNNAEVFLNGKKVGARPYGYIGFQVDLSPYIRFGEENVLAVRVDPKELSARWYPGAGIYRNVWLEIKHPVHIAHWGTYVTTPKVHSERAEVKVETLIQNEGGLKGRYQLKSSIIDASGAVVTSMKRKLDFQGDGTAVSNQILIIDNPELWDIQSPNLYTLASVLYRNGSMIDTYETSFGVRSIEFSSDKGFLLNGNQVRFRGVCLHHDLGPLGSAVNYRATERQLEIMKGMGVNSVRTSHNPPSPEFLELCDKMGILVQVEAFDEWKIAKVANGYHIYWDEWHETDLRDMIRRDRNHPSVVMWSIGNEIKEQGRKDGGELAASLTAICHDEDPTRPVTAGFNQYPACIKNGLAEAVDLVGFNYKPTQYSKVLTEHPEWIVYGAETSSCVSSRGVYHLPVENYDRHESLQVTSYDIISPPWAYPPDFEIYAQESEPRSLGEFIWTGFDYLGEPTPYNGRDNETHGMWGGDWPSRSSYFGAVDLSGFPKDRYYYYQSVWTQEPMVHILPHWNWEGTGHTTIPVYCYTNCDEAELFLNGKSLGKKVMGVDKTTIPAEFLWWKKPENTWDSPYRLNWNVRYEPGELKVVAYKNGQPAAEKTIVTAGAPARIRLIPDRNIIKADGYDLSFVTVRIEDEYGNICPLSDNLVQFKIEGPASVAAVGNGDATSTESFQADFRKAFNGLCMVIVKSQKETGGRVNIIAASEGLASASVQIETKSRQSGKIYYIDSQYGNDDNKGTSEDQAFASLSKANSLVLKAGDKLLFKSGTNYYGQLQPKGEGNQKHPVVIGKYGKGEKPAIHGQGKYLSTVHLHNMSFVELRDLEITNTGEQSQNGRRGVIVEAENYGVARNIVLDNLWIHDVNGSLVKSSGGGSAILWKNHGELLKSKFDSLIIQNCHIQNCSRNGINSRGYTKRDQWYPSTNVIIRNNLLEGVPGDGIVPIGTDGALIEYNVMRDCPDILSHQEAAAGIWPWSSDNTIIQFNEVSGHKAKWDGQGFDSDWNCLNTLIQYNYSHDNYGGFLLVCNNGGNYGTSSNAGTYNTIVRYNISVNDGIRPYETKRRGWFSPTMHISGPVEKTLIHHNLFVFPEKRDEHIDKTFIQMDNWGGPWPNKTLVTNNYMVFSEAYRLFYGESQHTFLAANQFDESKMVQENHGQIPDWARGYSEQHNEAWREKLVETFFKNNREMKKRIRRMN